MLEGRPLAARLGLRTGSRGLGPLDPGCPPPLAWPRAPAASALTATLPPRLCCSRARSSRRRVLFSVLEVAFAPLFTNGRSQQEGPLLRPPREVPARVLAGLFGRCGLRRLQAGLRHPHRAPRQGRARLRQEHDDPPLHQEHVRRRRSPRVGGPAAVHGRQRGLHLHQRRARHRRHCHPRVRQARGRQGGRHRPHVGDHPQGPHRP
jgi:hypothetical protein